MHVTPALGLSVRDPELMDLLPAEGREVPNNYYWNRRLRDGDVVSSDLKMVVKPAKQGGAKINDPV
jgi:hypothetical protein